MKIWLKMTLAVIAGILLGLFLPDFTKAPINDYIVFLAKLTLNSLLYLTIVYIFIKTFLGILNFKKNNLPYKTLGYFFLFILISVSVSILISIGLMNLNFFTPPEKNIPQISGFSFEKNTFIGLILKIMNDNVFTSFFTNSTGGDISLWILPIIFISLLLAVGANYSGKKALYFVDMLDSFDHILNKIIRQILEFFPFGVIFILTLLLKDRAFTPENLFFITRPLLAVAILSVFFILAYIVILFIMFRQEAPKFLLGFLGAGLMALVTGNTAASIIPLNEHIKKNHGVNKELSDLLVPLGMIINKSGTVIVSTVALISLIRLYSGDILSMPLQLLFFLIILVFSICLDGANANGFLMLVAMILNIPMLHLEGDSYLLFAMSLPIFGRIGLFIDTLSTALIVSAAAKLTNNMEMPKFVEFI